MCPIRTAEVDKEPYSRSCHGNQYHLVLWRSLRMVLFAARRRQSFKGFVHSSVIDLDEHRMVSLRFSVERAASPTLRPTQGGSLRHQACLRDGAHRALYSGRQLTLQGLRTKDDPQRPPSGLTQRREPGSDLLLAAAATIGDGCFANPALLVSLPIQKPTHEATL
jgi:hypothetical protein